MVNEAQYIDEFKDALDFIKELKTMDEVIQMVKEAYGQSIENNAPSETTGNKSGEKGGVKNCPKCQSTNIKLCTCPCGRMVCIDCQCLFDIEGDGVNYDKEKIHNIMKNKHKNKGGN